MATLLSHRLGRALAALAVLLGFSALTVLGPSATPAEAAPNAACGHGAKFTTKTVKGHRNVKMHIVASCIGITPRQIHVDSHIFENGNETGVLIRDKFQRVYRTQLYGRCADRCEGSSMVGRLTTDFYFSQPITLSGVPIGCVVLDPLHLHCLQSWNFSVERDGDIYMLP